MATTKKKQAARHSPQATNCRDCGRPFGPDRPRHFYMPSRCEPCGRAAARLANRRSYERRNRSQLGKRSGPSPGAIVQPPLTNAEIAVRMEAFQQQESFMAAHRDLPQTCEFCAKFGYKPCTNIRECELEAVGEPCRWEPAYKTDDGD